MEKRLYSIGSHIKRELATTDIVQMNFRHGSIMAILEEFIR